MFLLYLSAISKMEDIKRVFQYHGAKHKTDAGSWILIMVMWIIFFGGVMREMGAFEPLTKLCLKLSKKVRHLMFSR